MASRPGRDEKAIEEAAADWLMLMSERPLEDDEERSFQLWLGADARHAEMFGSMRRTWNDLDLVDAHPSSAARDIVPFKRRALTRPAWLAIAASAAAAITLVALIPDLHRARPQVQATELAQIRDVTLSDGTIVTLGAQSKISVRFSRDARRVVLDQGEAFFQIAQDANRPFVVEAGDALIRDIGTSFNVNRSNDRVSVSVLEGIVQVRRTALLNAIGRGDVQTLRAGDRVDLERLPPISFSAPLAHVAPALAPPGAWRNGRLVYDDARLGDLVADVNRYYGPGVRLSDPSLGDLRVTASFRPDEVAGIFEVLDEALPIDASRSATGALEVRHAQ